MTEPTLLLQSGLLSATTAGATIEKLPVDQLPGQTEIDFQQVYAQYETLSAGATQPGGAPIFNGNPLPVLRNDFSAVQTKPVNMDANSLATKGLLPQQPTTPSVVLTPVHRPPVIQEGAESIETTTLPSAHVDSQAEAASVQSTIETLNESQISTDQQPVNEAGASLSLTDQTTGEKFARVADSSEQAIPADTTAQPRNATVIVPAEFVRQEYINSNNNHAEQLEESSPAVILETSIPQLTLSSQQLQAKQVPLAYYSSLQSSDSFETASKVMRGADEIPDAEEILATSDDEADTLPVYNANTTVRNSGKEETGLAIKQMLPTSEDGQSAGKSNEYMIDDKFSPPSSAASSLQSMRLQPSSMVAPNLKMDLPVQDQGWSEQFSEQIKWMTGQKFQSVEIRLNPAHLGAMEVKIQMQNDQTNIQITALHATVRDALEQAMPRLREMFDASGLQLGDVDIADQSPAGEGRDQKRSDKQQPYLQPHKQEIEQLESDTVVTALPSPLEMRVLDLFA